MKSNNTTKFIALLILSLFIQTAFCQNDTISSASSQQELKQLNKKNTTKLELGIIAGASISTAIFNSLFESYFFLEEQNHISAISPLIGFKLIYTPKAKENLSFTGDIIYTTQYYEDTFVDYYYEYGYYVFDHSFGTSVIMMNLICKYYIVNKTFKPYVGAGISLSAKIAEKNKLILSYHHSESVDITEQDLFYEWKNSFLFGLNFETGIDYKNYSIGIRYNVKDFGKMKKMNAINHSFNVFLAYVI